MSWACETELYIFVEGVQHPKEEILQMVKTFFLSRQFDHPLTLLSHSTLFA